MQNCTTCLLALGHIYHITTCLISDATSLFNIFYILTYLMTQPFFIGAKIHLLYGLLPHVLLIFLFLIPAPNMLSLLMPKKHIYYCLLPYFFLPHPLCHYATCHVYCCLLPYFVFSTTSHYAIIPHCGTEIIVVMTLGPRNDWFMEKPEYKKSQASVPLTLKKNLTVSERKCWTI